MNNEPLDVPLLNFATVSREIENEISHCSLRLEDTTCFSGVESQFLANCRITFLELKQVVSDYLLQLLA